MIDYMSGDKMEWPAVDFRKARNCPLAKYAGSGIPCLVVIDAEGKVVSHSYEGETYVGPNKVMEDLDNLLKGS